MINLSICVRYFRFQKSIYVLHPLLVPDLIREFNKYYRTFPTNYGYVAFSMWVDDKQTLQMRGYIVGEQCTYFMNGICWKWLNVQIRTIVKNVDI